MDSKLFGEYLDEAEKLLRQYFSETDFMVSREFQKEVHDGESTVETLYVRTHPRSGRGKVVFITYISKRGMVYIHSVLGGIHGNAIRNMNYIVTEALKVLEEYIQQHLRCTV